MVNVERGTNRRKRFKRKRSPLKILLTIIIVTLFLSAASLFGASYYIIGQMSNHRVEKLEGTPGNLGLPEESVDMESSDGIQLKAWHIPQKSPRGVVVILHGMDGMDASSMLGLAKFIYNEGYSSLVLDMRAHGRSGGEKISFAYDEPKDVSAAVDWIKGRPEYKNVPVVLMGLSMGGASAIRTAARREDIDAVISISSYASVDEMASDFMKTGGMSDGLMKVTMPFMKLSLAVKFGILPSKSSPVYDIKNIPPRPILIAHGTADGQTNVRHAYELYEASGRKAELWIEEGADHCIFKGDGTGPEDEAYREKIIDFLDSALKTN